MEKMTNQKIPESKFSSITVYENGIKLSAITGVIDPDRNLYDRKNIYIRSEDMKELIALYREQPKRKTYNNAIEAEEAYFSEYDNDTDDDGEDGIFDANY